MEPLDDGQVLDDLGLPPDPSDTGNAPSDDSQTPATPDPAALQARLDALEKELETRDKRLRDTQSDWHRLNSDRQDAIRRADEAARLAREQAERNAAWERWAYAQQQQQVAQAATQQAELTPEEREALLTNPDYLNSKLQEVGRRSYEAAVQQLAPQVQQMQQMVWEQRNAMAPMWDQAADLAAYRAEQLAVNTYGMSSEDFRGNYEGARQAMWQAANVSAQREGGDPITKFNNLRANPQAVAMAVQWARAQSGTYAAPTYTPPTPMSAGNPNGSTRNVSRGTKSREQVEIEKTLGKEFTPAEAEAIRKRSRENAKAAMARGGAF